VKLRERLPGLLVVALVALLMVVGLTTALFSPFIGGEGQGAIVILAVFAVLIVQILHFHLLTRQLGRLEGKLQALSPAGPSGTADAQKQASAPSSSAPPSKTTHGSAGNPIHGSSRNPPPAKHKTSVPAGPVASQPAPPPATDPAEEELQFDDPAANRQTTLELWARMESGEALAFPPATGSGPEPAAARESNTAAGGARAVVLDALEVVQACNDYMVNGNGLFDARGLQEHLAAAGIRAAVLAPDNFVGMGAPVLGIAEPGSRERVFLLPDFTRPPKALAAWFDLDSEIRNSTRMNRLVRAAELRRSGERYELRQRGALE
jgi:hypothetical protein